ncbi:prepilin-type N-terminal cleavage/methylation domain-containing protein [Sulfurimonas sp. SWIR-19]|uniref:prepilin-type N-terminal cleavage/methylation domain-containing protein n=1 Tax=Sulfurimonas sp. SWIR-19 TaxID=2878390 RepID=UPI001CF214AE|nr:prepilin-type N-terminal cleavage/methylation domain-containing protein [Sulfurimonas sp. SWIR-19]UCN00590.1 prepilin-type N-terminal cleavage/methylation domain-containing protein [Sulfurimonas sp. SWIR-19]
MRKAFTLVEMLVGVVLLTLLIGVALFSFRLQLITIHKTKLSSINSAISYTQLRSVITSMKYYALQEYDIVKRVIPHSWYYFFDADAKKMKFITINPLFSNVDSLVCLTCKDKQLMYEEEPLYANMNFLQPDFSEEKKVLTLMKNLEKCSFSYKTRDEKQVTSLKNDLPRAVQINIEQNNKKYTFYIKVQTDANTTKASIEENLYDY